MQCHIALHASLVVRCPRGLIGNLPLVARLVQAQSASRSLGAGEQVMDNALALPKFSLQVASAKGKRVSVTTIEADYHKLKELHQELNRALLQARVYQCIFMCAASIVV